MSYESFRHFADSWGLLYMFAIFIGVVLFLLRPGAREQAKNAAQIPFNEER
ncbi:cbb3-type cytochrome c oxidase subunit 3 [Mariluticola halotolerans]|uniref:cbb3-type cytochrome c oxidase subunit 3 n=1 Tax=Mariluticola halotolerans TaxID=2909283 RepID=UPI0026E3E5B3|nr:cbb3-type cytochrome c oxidase subunit 3 [Mariluticola halotolerans]UJQ94675.1 cbb3-type cytochrome c oxidase subunit 3 [Mariluticola halotolerans]